MATTSAEVSDFVSHWRGKMGKKSVATDAAVVTKEQVLARARVLVEEHYDQLKGEGAGDRLRALLAAEFAGSKALKAVKPLQLSGMVSARGNAWIQNKAKSPAPTLKAEKQRAWRAARQGKMAAPVVTSPATVVETDIRGALDLALRLHEGGWIGKELRDQLVLEIMATEERRLALPPPRLVESEDGHDH